MGTIGFHASHELYSPSRLLELTRLSEQLGFENAMCSDHFRPWIERGQSGYAFSWLGAALQATHFSMGSVHAPGQRYHPALSAQAAATLCEMFPGRYWIALGSGQYLNESVTGGPWPDKETRNQRLLESVGIMRRLWNGECVTHDGLVKTREAKLYSLPAEPPKVYGAALSPETARWVGSWADGLIMTGNRHEEMEKIIHAFRSGGGAEKPILLQAALSFAPSYGEALEQAFRQWPVGAVKRQDIEDLAVPREFAQKTAGYSAQSIEGAFRISADADEHAEWLRKDFELGITEIYLHFLNENIEESLKCFAKEVLPAIPR